MCDRRRGRTVRAVPDTGPCLGAFAAVDASGDASALAGYLRAVRELPDLREERSLLLARLGVRTGMRVLDVGCGLGDDVLAFAERVGPGGHVAGLDASGAFLAQALARVRASGTSADLVLGDAHDLPFPGGSFDVVATERTLQHVDDPATVVAEMARVTVPGGLVALSEPDWGTLVLAGAPEAPTAAVLDELRAQFRHPDAGRRLVGLLAGAGLSDVRVWADSIHFTDPRPAAEVLALRPAAGRALGTDAPAWLDAVEEAGRERRFFAAATGFLVTARRAA
jgi:SAM-dependent methyltransferase